MIPGVVTASELGFGAIVILARMTAVAWRKVPLAILTPKGFTAVIPGVRASVITSTVAAVAAGLMIVIRGGVAVVTVVINRSATAIATAVTTAVTSTVIAAAIVATTATAAIHRRSKVHTG